MKGGIFTGYSHGGFYFAHGQEGIAFVNDAVMRCGHYRGIHFASFDPENDIPLAGAYVGGGTQTEYTCDMTVYLDNCAFDSASSSYGLTIRATSNEYGNTVNMSNCSMLKAGQLIRIDKENQWTHEPVSIPHHVNVGIGSGITQAMFENPDLTTFTGESYRRSMANFKALVEAASAEIQE